MSAGISSLSGRSFDLDFLRGLSVLGILFYHIVPGAPVGLGQGSMEFFFVISGYLITKTFARRLEKGSSGLQDFIFSRAKRLLPTLLLYLTLIIIVNLIQGKRPLLVAESTLYTVAGFYNWFQIFSTDTISGLGGIWSLSIEDQYYYLMLITGSFFLLCKIENVRRVFLVLYLSMSAASVIMRIYNIAHCDYSPGWISYNTVSRLWGFSCGGMVASLHEFSIEKLNGDKAKKLYSTLAIGALFVAYASLLSVKSYNAESFLTGWFVAPFFMSVCIYALCQVSTRKRLSKACLHKPLQKNGTLNKDLFFPNIRLLQIPAMFVSNVGVACYPIYLFQESDSLLGVKSHWAFSFLWALGVGFAVHNLWERRFYVFPRYYCLAARLS